MTTRTEGERVKVFAPGRVNLIGEHTDYTGGLVLPMALQLGITIDATVTADTFSLSSNNQDSDLLQRHPWGDATEVDPSWGRYIVAAANEMGGTVGLSGTITSSLPAGGTGLSTSAALTCATLLALGNEAGPMDVARMAWRAELAATGVLNGIMDPAACMNGVEGHALLLDCHTEQITPIPMPEGLQVLVVHSGERRQLVDSLYSERRDACFAAEDVIGPLRLANAPDVNQIQDPVVRKRARHVVSDNERVRQMVAAFSAGDIAVAAEILTAGHRSYADDFEASTPGVEAMVEKLEATPGIHAARMTGGGFGGSIVVFAEPGVEPVTDTWWTASSAGLGARDIEDE